MTPQARRAFEVEWPKLDVRLRRVLGRRGIPRDEWDDLVQETGARLYSMWERVDPGRPAFPLAATIMTNLLCDRARRSMLREVAGDVPERESLQDVERESFLRLDLDSVHRAVAALSTAQKQALFGELLGIEAVASRRDADKMLRMRARRKLASMVERVSALVPLRLMRAGDRCATRWPCARRFRRSPASPASWVHLPRSRPVGRPRSQHPSRTTERSARLLSSPLMLR